MLSTAARRFVAPARAVRAQSSMTAPAIEYSPKIFVGEVPTHYIPAKDAPADKAMSLYRQGATTQMQAEYGPNSGRWDYGRLAPGMERGLIKIFRQETAWGKRQLRNFAFMAAWMAPMMMLDYSKRNAREIGTGPNAQGDLKQPYAYMLFRAFKW